MSDQKQTVHVSIHDPRVNDVHPPQSTGHRVVNVNNGSHYDNGLSLMFESDDAAIAFGHAIIDTVRTAQKAEHVSYEDAVDKRLEYLRGEIRAERISYGELAELQSYAPYIDSGDVELLEWAGVPEK